MSVHPGIADEQDVGAEAESKMNHCKFSSGKSLPASSLASGVRSNVSSAVIWISSASVMVYNEPGNTVNVTELVTCCVPTPGTLNSYRTLMVQSPTICGSNLASIPSGVNQASACESAAVQAVAETYH